MAAADLLGLLDLAASGPGRVHFGADDDPGHAFADIWRDAACVGSWLDARFGRGEAVGGVLEPTRDCVATLLGAWVAGMTFVSLPAPGRAMAVDDYRSLIGAAARAADVQTVFGSGRTLELLAGREGTTPYPSPDSLHTRPLAGPLGPGHLVQFSSGSTAHPKGVLLGMDAIGANVAALAERFAFRPSDVSFSWLPLSHDMGLVGMCLAPLAAFGRSMGGIAAAWLTSPAAFARSPGSWLALASRVGGTVSATPNFGFAIPTPAHASQRRLRLRRIRCIAVGSDTVRPATLAAFTAAAAPAGLPATALCPAYGLAEATLAVTMDEPSGLWHSRRIGDTDGPELVSVGRPLSGVEVSIDGADGHGEGAVGEIRVAGPSLLTRFVGGGEAAAAFDGTSVLTGDHGTIVGGELYFVRRRHDVLVLRGRNVDATELELAVGDLAGVRAGNCVVFTPDDTGYTVVFEPAAADGEGAGLRSLCHSVASELGSRFGVTPSRVVAASRGAIHKTPSGKPQRHLVRDHLAAGSLPTEADVPFSRAG